jgi:hypothetical protein
MKKIVLLILCIPAFFNISMAQSTFLNFGRTNVALGTGFGIYNVSNNEYGKKDDGALNGNLQVSIDYGFAPLIAVGVTAFRNGFVTNKDSNDAARMGGLGLYANLNFIRLKSANIYLTGGFGGTGFVYENLNNKGKVRSTGSYGLLGLGFRKYFLKHVGFYSQLQYTGYSYNKLWYSDDSVLKTPSENTYQIALVGVEAKLGLLFSW